MDATLSITLTGTGISDDQPPIWVRLEQERLSEVAQGANFADLFQMITMARGGASARIYKKDDCPIAEVGGVAGVALNFWSFPSAMDLQYTVTASLGVLGEPIRVELAREFDLVLTGERVELPFVASGLTIEWLTPAFNSDWRVVGRPNITVEDTALVLSAPLAFGVVRVRCTAHGYLHTVVMDLVRQEVFPDEVGNLNLTGYHTDNLACAVTAAWVDEVRQHQTEILELEIPKCIEDYLVTCPDGQTKTGGASSGGGDEPGTVVYYNSCTGDIIDIRYP